MPPNGVPGPVTAVKGLADPIPQPLHMHPRLGSDSPLQRPTDTCLNPGREGHLQAFGCVSSSLCTRGRTEGWGEERNQATGRTWEPVSRLELVTTIRVRAADLMMAAE